MVYGWNEHKDVCFRLYIEEHKPLEEIMHHMRETYGFTPSKRAYQTQFKRWNFPSKQNPAHRNTELVSRVKQLWEQNYTQREMLDTLVSEGFDIKERELMRVRAKNRWLLRVPNGAKQEQISDLFGDYDDDPSEISLLPVSLPDEITRKRKERHDQLKTESDQRWASKKRRRRTKEYAGIPADPPGPPRFPSETTLDEGKQILGLSSQQYRELRDQFQEICLQENVVKKTDAGPEKWQEVKQRLIQENSHLKAIFWTDESDLKLQHLALDVICTDVTKRMRTTNQRMTIADAKNTLGINPEQSREIRNAFYKTLQNDHFTSKLEIGQDHWQELKDEWFSQTPILQEILVQDGDDNTTKLKALEVLCRDVMKRLRDDQAKRRIRADTQNLETFQPLPDLPDLQIDPSLLQPVPVPAPTPPTAVYIRPHPESQIHSSAKMWLTSMTTRKVGELKGILTKKWPDAKAVRIDGVEKSETGQEISYLIEDDEELDAYLDHVEGRKAVFVVLLNSTG